MAAPHTLEHAHARFSGSRSPLRLRPLRRHLQEREFGVIHWILACVVGIALAAALSTLA